MLIRDLLVPLESAVSRVTPEDFASVYHPLEDIGEIKHSSEWDAWISEHLVPVLKSVPDLAVVADRMRFGSTDKDKNYPFLGYKLIARAVEVGAATTVEELERHVRDDSYRVHQMLFFGGAKISEKVELSSGIFLLPFDPNDKNCLRLLVPGTIGTEGYAEGMRISGSLATYHEYKEDVRPRYRFGESQELWDFSNLEDALLCLTLIGPSGPVVIGTSIAPVGWAPGYEGAIGGQVPRYVEVKYPERNLTGSEAERLGSVYSSFVALPENVKKQLRVSVKRLNSAVRRFSEVDAAIDLGIALETLLANDLSPDASIGFTIRLRAARLLRGSYEDRQAISQLLTDLYTLRSKAVHAGELPDKVRRVASSEVLSRGAAIVAEVAEHIVVNGGFPDWHRTIFE